MGAAIGGIAGAAGGTLIAPGLGTLAGGLSAAEAGSVAGGVAGAVAGAVIGTAIENSFGNVVFSRPPGYWTADEGAMEWGRRNGIGANYGRRLFHNLKRRSKAGAGDNFSVNPATGDVLDPNDESAGNLNEEEMNERRR